MSNEWIHLGRRIARFAVAACLLVLLVGSHAHASEKEARKLDAAQVDLQAATVRAEGVLREIEVTQGQLERARQRESIARERVVVAREDLRTAKAELQSERSEAAKEVERAAAQDKVARDEWEGGILALAGVAGMLLVLGIGFMQWMALLVSKPVRHLAGVEPKKNGLVIVGGAIIGVLVGLMIGGAGSRIGLILGGLVSGGSVGAGIVLGVATWDARRLIADRPAPFRKRAFHGLRAKGMVGGFAAIAVVLMLAASLASTEPSAEAVPAETLALAEMGSVDADPSPRVRVLATAVEDREAAVNARANARKRLEGRLRIKADRLGFAKSRIKGARRTVARWQAALDRPDPAPVETYATYPDEDVAPEPETSSASSGCDPNYSGCVPVYPPDVNCSEVGGSVTVVGSDPHGLDADGDGVGCE